MALQKIDVSLSGITPLLMHRYPMESIEAIDKKTPKEQAEIAAYRTPQNELYVPGTAIQRALVDAATFSKGKGRASLQRSAAACIMVSPEYVLLGTNEYLIDTRSVVIPATKGRTPRYRPRFDKWKISFSLEYDDALITGEQIRKIVDDMGTRVGLLDFRPACKGSFGRSVVVEWRVVA